MDNLTLRKLHSIEVNILDEIVRICEENGLEYFLIGGTLLGAIRHKGFIPWDDDLDIAMPRDSYNKFINLCIIDLNKEFILDYIKNNSGYWLPFAKVRKKNTIYEQLIIYKKNNVPKGIWVDIFPLDNVKYKRSILQFLQAKLVKNITIYITLKQEYNSPRSLIAKILYKALKVFSVKSAFAIQERIMTKWNKKETKYYVNLGSQYGHIKQTIAKDKYYPPTKVEFEGKLYNVPNDWDYVLKRIYGDYMQLPPIEKRVTHNPVRIEFGDESSESK